MDGENLPLGPYPVLEGVAPDSASSATFEHLESVEVAQDAPEATPDPHDTLASSYSLYASRPLGIPRPRPPPRQNNCYHSIVTRQWRVAEYETCDTCGRRPFLRWFYLCTEDTSGYLASNYRNGSFLSSWMTEAILAGEYTNAQRDLLFEQKLGVLEMCEKERGLAHASLSIHKARFETKVFEQQEGGGSQAHLSGLDLEAGPSNAVPQLPSRPARCHYRSCYHCDRRLQERAWLSLNGVCSDPDVRAPSAWELWETPVSEVDHVRNLGLRTPPPIPPPHTSTYVYRASQHRQIRRSSRHYLAGYESSISVALMTELTTIEEEIEIDQTQVVVNMAAM
ncbi:hypothetical protein BDV12DRAFT_179106 [Aspergillus spectabilis]